MTAAVARPRLQTIDALRGVAAMVVVAQHSAELLWIDYAKWSVSVFRPGEFGVFVFFMVSGFVIPLSIERERDPISFWIGRFFRLFPLYWVLLVSAVLLWRFGDYGVKPGLAADPWRSVVANGTMAQNFLGFDNVIGPAWSLAYELVFYLLITVLIVAGLTRSAVRTTLTVLGLACSVGVLIGPAYLLNSQPREKGLLVAAGIAIAAATALWPRLTDARAKVVGTVCTAAVIGLVLNQHLDLWFSLFLFATIGCGWVYHEAHKGRVAPWVPFVISGLTIVLVTIQLRMWVIPHEGLFGAQITWRSDAATLVAAHATFALVYLVRHRSSPRPFNFLGQISYSLYLVHALVLGAWRPFPDEPVLRFTAWVVATVAISIVTYRIIELPSQRLGHRLRANWRERAAAGEQARTATDAPGPGTVTAPV